MASFLGPALYFFLAAKMLTDPGSGITQIAPAQITLGSSLTDKNVKCKEIINFYVDASHSMLQYSYYKKELTYMSACKIPGIQL